MEEKREYAAVDIFKMFCAILVMLIHTKPFENIFWLDAAVGMLTRFAVPFFFTVSGYFVFAKIARNNENKWRIIIQYLLRLLRFYIIWFVVLRIFDVIIGGASIQTFDYYIKQFFFTTDGSALWFVAALMWAVLIVSILTIKIREELIFAFSILFLSIGYCCSTLLGISNNWVIVKALKPITAFIGVQGSLFFAFPYVAMGAMLSRKTISPAIKRDVFFILLFFLCLGCESLLMVRKYSAPLTFLWIAAVPMIYYTVHLMLSLPLESKKGYYVVRKISTLCYVLHIVVFKSLLYIFRHTGNIVHDPQNILLTVLTIIITLAIAYGIFLISKLKLFHWVKKLM